MITIHKLKTIQPFFDHVKQGYKSFEIRKNDRDFKVGDILILQEYDAQNQNYSGEELVREVLYTFPGGQFGVDENMVVMSMKTPSRLKIEELELVKWENRHANALII